MQHTQKVPLTKTPRYNISVPFANKMPLPTPVISNVYFQRVYRRVFIHTKSSPAHFQSSYNTHSSSEVYDENLKAAVTLAIVVFKSQEKNSNRVESPRRSKRRGKSNRRDCHPVRSMCYSPSGVERSMSSVA